jgi:transcriptional regulator with XRE-family HTH domain
MTAFSDIFSSESFEGRVSQKLESMTLSFQLAICEEMERQGITKSGLASRMNVSAARVSQLIGGSSSNLTFKSIAKIAEALDCDFEVVERRKYVEAVAYGRHRKPDALKHGAAASYPMSDFWQNRSANKNRFPQVVAA